jgi:hypothetical protein
MNDLNELRDIIERALDQTIVRRRGIFARDIDLLLAVRYRLELGRRPTNSQARKLDDVLARLKTAPVWPTRRERKLAARGLTPEEVAFLVAHAR